jgi:hypothetical protein
MVNKIFIINQVLLESREGLVVIGGGFALQLLPYETIQPSIPIAWISVPVFVVKVKIVVKVHLTCF